MTTTIFYREQADLQSREADAATLDNVRDRCLRAAIAWTVLADRMQRLEAQRVAERPAAAAAPSKTGWIGVRRPD
jgi:hypothetical protein